MSLIIKNSSSGSRILCLYFNKWRKGTYSSWVWSLSTAAKASRAFLVSGDGERAKKKHNKTKT